MADCLLDRGAELKIILMLAVWMLASGIAYLVGDIAFGSDIEKYIESANMTLLCVVGGLVVAAVYSCWYLLRKEKRVTDILVPVCMLLVWGLARRKMLYAGGRGVIYSIAYELKKAYGIKTGAFDLDYRQIFTAIRFSPFSAFSICTASARKCSKILPIYPPFCCLSSVLT